MDSVVDNFKKHWFVSMIGICIGVAATVWTVAAMVLEQPLKNQLALADREKAFLVSQIGNTQLPPSAEPDTKYASDQPIGTAPKTSADQAVSNKTCAALEIGNKLYIEQKYEQAVAAYLKVQEIDKIGRTPCVASAYATVGTIYTLIGDRAVTSNPEEAIKAFRLASKFNRAFAVALMCHLSECQSSTTFWSQ
jgi:tetratricopeptide (TPR) repeat protein